MLFWRSSAHVSRIHLCRGDTTLYLLQFRTVAWPRAGLLYTFFGLLGFLCWGRLVGIIIGHVWTSEVVDFRMATSWCALELEHGSMDWAWSKTSDDTWSGLWHSEFSGTSSAVSATAGNGSARQHRHDNKGGLGMVREGVWCLETYPGVGNCFPLLAYPAGFFGGSFSCLCHVWLLFRDRLFCTKKETSNHSS